MTIESEHVLMLSSLQRYADNCDECHGLGEYDMLYYHVQGEPTTEHVKCSTCTWARDVLAQIDVDDVDDSDDEWVIMKITLQYYQLDSSINTYHLSPAPVRNVKLLLTSQYYGDGLEVMHVDNYVDAETGEFHIKQFLDDNPLVNILGALGLQYECHKDQLYA